jgi:acyl-CoA synthetase (AMP-forming)/AMP-acid ligase II
MQGHRRGKHVSSLLVERIKGQAAAKPLAPATVGPGEIVTYDELFRRICAIANHFDDRKLPRRARVFLNIGNPDLRMAALIAALDYGLTPLLAHPETLKGNLEYDFVVGAPDVIHTDIVADVVIDEAVLWGRFADVRPRSFPDGDANDLSWVAETSGTTGRPKLVAVTHGQQQIRMAEADRFKPTDRVFFSVGSTSKYVVARTMKALSEGVVVMNSLLDASTNLRLINLFNATYLIITPGFAERALDLMEAEKVRCPSVREIHVTGAAPSRSLLERIEGRFAARVWIGYGTSEIEGGISRWVATSATYVNGYVGKINSALKLTTTGTKANPGPIVIAHDKDHFTRTIVAGRIVQHDEPFYTLPDIGHIEGDVLYLAGRSDEVYNSGGNIKAYSLIAEEIAGLARVKDVAIVNGAPVGNARDLIIGIVAGRPLNLAELTAKLVDRLQMAQAERHFRLFQLGAIPRNPQSGKVDRGALLREFQNHTTSRDSTASVVSEAVI